MTAVDGLRFAVAALTGHRLRAGLSLLGVAVGVASVVLLSSLGEGARVFVVGEFAALGSNLLVVRPGRTETTGFAPPVGGAPHDLTLEDAAAMRRRVARVTRVAPMTVGSATVRFGDLTRDSRILGVTADWKDVRRIDIAAGQFLPDDDADRGEAVCVVGTTIQTELFGGRSALGALLRVGDERFRVIGITSSRGTSLGMNLDEAVILPIGRHMKMFGLTSVFQILVELSSHAVLPEARQDVIDLLVTRHHEEDVTVITQDSMLSTFSRLLSILTMGLAGIAGISLSVAGIGIMNVMLVSVSERTREIGLLKALGATPGQILRLFLTEAAMLSAAGGAVGLLVASGLTVVARHMYPAFPMQAPFWAMPSAIIVSLAVGLFFGVLPAHRAARLDPIGALNRR